jgi:hypothetical protein
MELIYIGNHQSRFIQGQRYRVISITDVPYQKLRILDKDGVYQEFDSDIVWNYFKTINVYRNERLESIGI